MKQSSQKESEEFAMQVNASTVAESYFNTFVQFFYLVVRYGSFQNRQELYQSHACELFVQKAH
jgi:hypothetical protein